MFLRHYYGFRGSTQKVVGFINSTIIEPNLTTVDQPGNKIGTVAVQYLLDEIKKEVEINHKTVEIKTKLIVRESSFKSTFLI